MPWRSRGGYITVVLPGPFELVCRLAYNLARRPVGLMQEHPLVEVIGPERGALVHRIPVKDRHLFGAIQRAKLAIRQSGLGPFLLVVQPVLIRINVQRLLFGPQESQRCL